jgi:hypothetical protein
MSLWFDTEQDDRTAVKTAVALAVSRYRDTVGKFVQGKPERLILVDEQIGRIARECAEVSRASEGDVESKFRAFLADAVAVSEPERQKVTDEAEYNNSDEVPQPEDGARDDIKSDEPILDQRPDQIDLDGESTVDSNSYISCELCKNAALENSILCEACNEFVITGERKEAIGSPVTCPQCGHPMTPLQNPQNPGAVTQQQCPNCGASFTPGQAGTQPTVPQPTGVGGGMYAKTVIGEEGPIGQKKCKCGHPEYAHDPNAGCEMCAKLDDPEMQVGHKFTPKTAQGGGDLQDPDSPVEENVQSPAEEDSSDQQLPPAAKQDSNGPAEVYTGVVEQTANANAAMAWSTPGDQDIQQISQEYGIDPDTVRKNLKIVADFGDALAVNGDPNADPNMEGMTPLVNYGGRIPTTEEEVDVDNAISHTADRTGLSADDVYALVKESYGGDIGGQHYVSVSGEAHYYLPKELVGDQQSQQPDVDSPQETQQDAMVSSVPAHLQSLTAFIDWEKAQRESA